ncbi:carbon-nitrogen hydrolase family protein [Gordonia sp. CPCC 206044]|uniref:carbon-nitrogen hydrolase family protein n=1 Tax=Gordonia sp. CPCC 206044 TaxID=3140793 RepID=UPI003AF35575
MTDSSQLRIALWQCESRPGSVTHNLGRLAATAAAAAARSADLLITPEMYVTGYAIGADARRLADPVSGPIADAVGAIARTERIAILYGCPQRGSDGAVYNAIHLVANDGKMLATHHKTHLYGELDRRMVEAGSVPPPVVALDGWQLGLMTCYEVEFPELVRSLAVRGAEVVCVPTANMIEFDAVQSVLLPARALENQVYVAYANYCGAEADLTYGGLSEMVSPTGRMVGSAGRSPQLTVVDAVRDDLLRSRAEYTYLRDRRPELY